MDGALTIGGRGTEHIVWESAGTFVERCMREQIERKANAWLKAEARRGFEGSHKDEADGLPVTGVNKLNL